MAPPTPEERALGWTIELITTTPALGADAKLKIMAALGPQLVGYALPDHIKARIILDALNLHTRHFTHVDAENAELVFESLITVGDVAQAEATRVGGFELPQPPMFLTAMSYCETVVSALREPGAPDIEAFHENCDTYDLLDVASQSKWLDRKTLVNLQRALKKDAVGLTSGTLDPQRVLQNHHTANKLCAALAAYAKAVIEKLGPSFLERVARDIGDGTYAPDTETRVDSGGHKVPTGIVVPERVAAHSVGVEKGFSDGTGVGGAPETSETEEEEDETSDDEDARPRHESPNAGGASRVVPQPAVAKPLQPPTHGDAWQTLAKHAESAGEAHDGARSEDEFAFSASDGDDDESPGAAVAAAKRLKRFAEIAKPAAGGDLPVGKTIAWGASQLGETQVTPVPSNTARPVGGGGGTTAAVAKRTTPGSIGRKYQRWSREEEVYFLGLCDTVGEGNWAAMLSRGTREGKLREGLTSVHLKDKWRNLNKKRLR